MVIWPAEAAGRAVGQGFLSRASIRTGRVWPGIYDLRFTIDDFQTMKNEEAARNREELLISVLNPRFNGAGKVWPRDLWFTIDDLRFETPNPASKGKEKGKMKKDEGSGSQLLVVGSY